MFNATGDTTEKRTLYCLDPSICFRAFVRTSILHLLLQDFVNLKRPFICWRAHTWRQYIRTLEALMVLCVMPSERLHNTHQDSVPPPIQNPSSEGQTHVLVCASLSPLPSVCSFGLLDILMAGDFGRYQVHHCPVPTSFSPV